MTTNKKLKKIKRLPILIACVPIFLIMKLVNIFFPYKFYLLGIERIGHLALEPELLLRQKYLKTHNSDCFHILITDSRADIANTYFFNLLKSYFLVINSHFLFEFVKEYKDNRLVKLFNVFYSYPPGRNFAIEYARNKDAPAQIKLPLKDIVQGKEILLSQFNVDTNKDKIICIFARDSQYLTNTFPENNWSHHDYRDMDIDTYLEAIKYLCDQGYKVFRLGKIVAKPVNYQHPNFFDYALTKARSDFLDIYLIYTAYLTIGTPSGITDIPAVFDKPCLSLGFAPPFFMPIGKNALFIPKKICHNELGQEVPFAALLNLLNTLKKAGNFSFSNASDMKHIKLSYVENSAEEILAATKEMLARLDGTWSPSPEEKQLEQSYLNHWKLARSNEFLKSPISLSWLMMNQHLLV